MTVCPVTIKHEKLILRGRCFNDLRLFSSDAFILSYSKNRPPASGYFPPPTAGEAITQRHSPGRSGLPCY
jgi:hypothetical protein